MRVLALFIWLLPSVVAAQSNLTLTLPEHPMFDRYKRVQSFSCANVSCKRLRSCEEACHKLLVCGQSIRDGDNDGIPCENLCSRRC